MGRPVRTPTHSLLISCAILLRRRRAVRGARCARSLRPLLASTSPTVLCQPGARDLELIARSLLHRRTPRARHCVRALYLLLPQLSYTAQPPLPTVLTARCGQPSHTRSTVQTCASSNRNSTATSGKNTLPSRAAEAPNRRARVPLGRTRAPDQPRHERRTTVRVPSGCVSHRAARNRGSIHECTANSGSGISGSRPSCISHIVQYLHCKALAGDSLVGTPLGRRSLSLET